MDKPRKPSICPICGQGYNEPPAISRRDNKTAICPDCGLKEALQDFIKAERRWAQNVED